MSESTPRGPVDPPDPEHGASGAGGPQQPSWSDRPTEPQQPAAPGSPASFRVGEALGYAWGKFTGNTLMWILFTLLLLVVGIVFNSGNVTSYQGITDPGDLSAEINVGGSLFGLIGTFLVAVIQGLGVGGALREASGQKPTFASLFQPANLGAIVVAALLLIGASIVGSLLCGVGLLVVAVFAVFTYQGVIDRNQNAWEAFIASFRLVGQNFGAVFLLELALLGINILGAIPCGLGLLITIPLTYLALSFAYRRLTGGLTLV